ncbi:hypothetical protein KC343_g13091, partial [Hortaea werneckii]
MSIPLLPQLPPIDPATSTIHDFLTNLSLSRTPLQIPASSFNNTAGGSGGRVESGTLYIFPERTFRLLQAVMIACFTMLCLLSWLAAFLTTRKAGMLAIEVGIWKGMRGWAERRRVVEMRGKMGGQEAGSDGGRKNHGQREVEDSEKKRSKETEAASFLDRILLRFLLLKTQSPTQPERANVDHRDGGSQESQPHHTHNHHLHPLHSPPQPRLQSAPPPPPPPPPHLPTLPTLLITLLSLTKHIPLILCTSAPGNEILRWFIHLPEYAGVII